MGAKKPRTKREYRLFITHKCPICGREFFPTDEWVYNDGTYYSKKVCSYPCHMEARRRIEEAKISKRHYKSKPIPVGRDEEIRKLVSEGIHPKELAVKYEVSEARIRQIVSQGKAVR